MSRTLTKEQFIGWLKSTHPTVPYEDLERSDVPGYWDRKTPCNGGGNCGNCIHRTMFNNGPIHHTISYHDDGRDESGKWASNTRTWVAAGKWKEETNER